MRKTVAPISWWRNSITLSLGLALCVGCVTGRPSLEYVLAQQAFFAAKEVDAARYAPAFYHKSEEAYRKGVNLYNNREYTDAIESFRLARVFAEKAENAARVQRYKSGDEGI